MCGRYTLSSPTSGIADVFEVETPPTADPSVSNIRDPEGLLAPRYNIAPTQSVLVVRGEAGARRMVLMRWGLVPFWRRSLREGPLCINARAETLAEARAYREAYRARRCLIPADGFFEWRKEEGGKQPYLIRPPEPGIIAFAGLWERWRDADTTLFSCTIVTTEANEWVRPIHDRMPVILRPASWAAWLDPAATRADLDPLLRPYDAPLVLTPVSRRLNRASVDNAAEGKQGPELLEPPSPSASSASDEPDPPKGRQLNLF